MKKQSRVFVILLAFVLSVSMLTGCGSSEKSSSGSSAPKGTYTSSKVDSDLSMADDVKSFVKNVDMDYAYDLSEKLAYDEAYWDNDLGWRSAGSDAEHKTADFLEQEMKDLGLSEVQKIATPCDKFQFNDSNLTIEGTKINLKPASYQVNGTGADGLDAEIVDVGHGLESDYEGKDVKGKIVIAAIDQKDEAWIDGYEEQAYEKGAAALITYSRSGYGSLNDDTINVQDNCGADLLPTCAVSKNQGKKIKKAIKNGHNQAHLMLDAEMVDDGGTTYNIVGMIPGKNHEQRIIVSGHYDKYWYGFQDDSCAIGLVLTVAKAMLDSGYQPENDIVFIAHGAEEWGVTDSPFDWTTGAWGLIEKQTGWQGTTIAMLNTELPAVKGVKNVLRLGSVPEFGTLSRKVIGDSGLVVTAGKVALGLKPLEASTMEDGVTYRWHGVPYFINDMSNEKFMYGRYHTTSDDKDTYDKASMQTNINLYGAMAMYIDTEPALELDFTKTAKQLRANFSEKIAKQAGVDVDAYNDALDGFEEAAKKRNEEIAKINEDYEEAAKSGDTAKMEELRTQGRAANKETLKVFQDVQTDFMKVSDFGVTYGHYSIDYNVKMLRATIKGLKNKKLWSEEEDGSGALDNAWQINSGLDYCYCLFSTSATNRIMQKYKPEDQVRNESQFGYQKTVPVIEVGSMTHDLNAQSDDPSKVDWNAAKKVYQSGLDTALKQVKTYSDQEINDMKAITAEL